MELATTFVRETGAYLLLHNESKTQLKGIFCWSGQQILQTLYAHQISSTRVRDLEQVLHDPRRSRIPFTHAKQPILIEGKTAFLIASTFQMYEKLEKSEYSPRLSYFHGVLSTASKQLINCAIDGSNKDQRVAVIFYVDDHRVANMAILRCQLHGLTVLSYPWIEEEHKELLLRNLAKLPVMGDDLDFPTLVQGDIIKFLMAANLVMMRDFSESKPDSNIS